MSVPKITDRIVGTARVATVRHHIYWWVADVFQVWSNRLNRRANRIPFRKISR